MLAIAKTLKYPVKTIVSFTVIHRTRQVARGKNLRIIIVSICVSLNVHLCV